MDTWFPERVVGGEGRYVGVERVLTESDMERVIVYIKFLSEIYWYILVYSSVCLKERERERVTLTFGGETDS